MNAADGCYTCDPETAVVADNGTPYLCGPCRERFGLEEVTEVRRTPAAAIAADMRQPEN